MTDNTYSKQEKYYYLLGLAGQNIIYGIITSSLAYFLQFTILIPSVWTGVILSTARIYDAVKDPLAGALMSRSKISFKAYLIKLPIPTAILTIMCFANFVYSSSNTTVKNALIIISAFVFYLLWETVFTLGDIPITAYPSLLTKVESDKTRLLSLRPIGSMASSISTLAVQPIAFALAGWIGNSQNAERNSFLITVVFFSLIGGALFQLTAVKSTQRVTVKNDNTQNQFKYFITNPLLRKITVSGILGSMKSMTGVILTPLVTYYFSDKDPAKTLFYTLLLGAGSFVGMIVSMTIVPKFAEKLTNRKIYIFFNLFNVLPNVLIFVLYLCFPKNMTNIVQLSLMFVMTLISGSCLSISTIVQTLIISEAVELEYRISGNTPAAFFFSCQTFLIKIGMGISSLLASLGYSIIHFSSEETQLLNKFIAQGGVPRITDEYSSLMTLMFFLYTIPAAISSLLCIIPFIECNFISERNKIKE